MWYKLHMEKSVYLCGPITGLSYGDCTNWRQYAAKHLKHNIVPLDPMRCKEYLQHETEIKHSYEDGEFGALLSSERHFFHRDILDVAATDMLLVNFLGATSVSIGSVSEMGMAHAQKKGIVLVMEKEGNLHDHPFIRQMAGWRADTLDKGIEVINAVLGTMVR